MVMCMLPCRAAMVGSRDVIAVMLQCWHWIPALLSVETLVAVVVWGRAVEAAAGTLVVKVVYAFSVRSLFFRGGMR
jgi:hypothetical protein